jgi:hypothetical protein
VGSVLEDWKLSCMELSILDSYCCFGRMTRELLLSGFTITVVLFLSFDQMNLMVWASEHALTLWDVCSCWWSVSIHSGYLSPVEVAVSRW